MKRIFAAAALALATGCRGPSQVYDPFLGRTTVDPPGTASPPPGQPYYGAPPVTAPAAPVPRYGSPNFAPTPAGGAGLSSSFTPNVSPTQPVSTPPGKAGTLPITPVSNSGRPAYPPPGGTGPQAQFSPGSGSPTLAQAGSAATAQSNPPAALDVDRILAARGTTVATGSSTGGTVGTTNSDSNATARSNNATPVAFSSPGSTIRIVEPASSPGTVSRSGDLGNASSSSPLSSTSGAAPGIFRPAGPTSAIMPASAASSTLTQSVSGGAGMASTATALNRVPEISELPPAINRVPATGLPPRSGVTRVSSPGGGILANQASNVAAGANGSAVTTSPSRGAIPSASTSDSGSGYAYDSQYRSLKGKLEYAQSTHEWRLRYIPPDGNSTDNFGGSVILADAGKLNGLQAGDFVAVQGSAGTPGGTPGSFAPLYNVDRIQKQ